MIFQNHLRAPVELQLHHRQGDGGHSQLSTPERRPLRIRVRVPAVDAVQFAQAADRKRRRLPFKVDGQGIVSLVQTPVRRGKTRG